MAKAKKKTATVTMQAKCVMGHKFTMSETDQKVARDIGCAMCPTCGNPAFVTKISGKVSHA